MRFDIAKTYLRRMNEDENWPHLPEKVKAHGEGQRCDAPLRWCAAMPRPKNKVWKRKPMPRYWHTKRPDLDNLVKAVLDALNGLAWRDDAQIHTLNISKVVAAGDEQPHVQVRIAEEACT